MKKAKFFVAALLAGTVAASVCAFTACNNDKPEDDNPPATTAKITDGVFNCVVQGTREILIKLYEDNTYFAMGAMGDVYRGTYVYHEDVSVQYVNYGDDCNFDGTDSTTILTSTASVEFKDEDGKASTNIVRQPLTQKPEGVGADYELPQFSNTTTENYIAYADDTLQMCKVGSFGRALKHNANKAFTKDDEPAVLEHKFMVEEDSDKIQGVVTQQMLTLELFDKKFVDKVSASTDIEGKLTKSGNVYTLTYKDGTATVTVSEDGSTAVWKKGDVTINYVKYAEKVKKADYHFEGSAFQGAVKLNAYLYNDNTVEVIATKQGADTVLASGTWAKGAGFPTITLNKGTATVSGTSATDVKLTLNADLGTGTAADYVLTIAAVEPEISYHFEGSAFSGAVKLTAYLYDDNTVKIIANKQGADTVFTTGTWAKGAGFPTITLDKGTATVSGTSVTDVKLTLNADLGTGSAAYVLTIVTK